MSSSRYVRVVWGEGGSPLAISLRSSPHVVSNLHFVRHQAMDTKTRQLLINPIVPENLGTASFYSISNSQYIIARLEELSAGDVDELRS